MHSELSQLGAAHRLEDTEGDANEAESGSARRRSTSTHLLRLATALVLPVLVFAGVLAWYYVVAQRERIDESALSAARELSTAVDRELGSYIVMLQALATAPELQRGDIRGFYQRASGIYNALGANIVLRAPGEAIPLMNTSVPGGPRLQAGTRRSLRLNSRLFGQGSRSSPI